MLLATLLVALAGGTNSMATAAAFTPEVQDHCETVERNGGRREQHTCTVLEGPSLCEGVAAPFE